MIRDGDTTQKVYKVHHRKLRAYHTLPLTISRYLQLDASGPLECVRLDDSPEVHPVSMVSSDEDEGSEPKKKRNSQSHEIGKRNRARRERCEGKRAISKSLSALQCSESVKHSTPVTDHEQKMSDGFPQDLSTIMEQIFSVQEELNEQANRLVTIVEKSYNEEFSVPKEQSCALNENISEVSNQMTTVNENGEKEESDMSFKWFCPRNE